MSLPTATFTKVRPELVWFGGIVIGLITIFGFFSNSFASVERVNGIEKRQDRQEQQIHQRLQRIDDKLDTIQRDMMRAKPK